MLQTVEYMTARFLCAETLFDGALRLGYGKKNDISYQESLCHQVILAFRLFSSCTFLVSIMIVTPI